ncbi:MAG: YjgN family protein, partial [Alphaproteobacteria bacterium]
MGGELFGIVIVNVLLSVVTLSFYRFWARTRVRRYLWSHISFLDDRFEYTGRGKELFLGFLIVIGVFIPFVVIFQLVDVFVGEDAPSLVQGVETAYPFAFLFLVQIAIFRARRYRLSRTQWRGIRGAQTGSAIQYAVRALGYLILTVATLGIALPFKNTRLTTYKLNNTWFGDRQVQFEGRPSDLMATWLKCWLLLLPTFGLSYFWYRAAQIRYFARCTEFEALRFKSDVRGRQLLWVYIPYWLI